MEAELIELEYKLHESLVKLQEMITLLEFDEDILKKISYCKDLLKDKKYIVAVMGEFRRGKSSLINALLGSKILPANATPTTATINRITYGTNPKVVLTYKDGRTPEQIDINRLSEYVTKENQQGETRALQIKEATVYYPTVICQNHVDIIDTPGLNDEQNMTKITLDMLDDVDAVVIPIHARSPFSDTEKNFVCQLLERENIDNIVFVVTFIDQLDEEDYEYEAFINYIKKRIHTNVLDELKRCKKEERLVTKAEKILNDIHIYGISSVMALKAFLSNNQTILKESRFELFQSSLLRIITAKQLNHAVHTAIENIRWVVSQMESQNQRKLAAMKQQIDSLRAQQDKIQEYSNHVVSTLSEIFESDYETIFTMINDVNRQKNIQVQEFVATLSKYGYKNTEDIQKNLSDTAMKIVKDTNQSVCTMIRTKLLTVLNHQCDSFLAYRRAHLTAIADLDKEEKSIEQKLHTCFNQELGKVEYRWRQSPIPASTNLITYNIMDPIASAVDVSVKVLIQDYQNCLTNIRKYWFAIAKEDSSKHLLTTIAGIEESLKVINDKEKMYLQNYTILSHNARVVMEECNTMCHGTSAKSADTW